MLAPPIHDYAMIGDCRTTALISKEGSIDWLGWPQFDSPSLLGALLDSKIGGHFSIRPVLSTRVTRRYVEDTNVLETRFESPSATVVVRDWMPVGREDEKQTEAWPEHEILRQVTCERGEDVIELELELRPGYGRTRLRPRNGRGLGIQFEAASALINFRGEVPLSPTERGARATFTLRAGESAAFSLSYATSAPAVLPPLGARVQHELGHTLAWWRDWAARTRYAGERRDAIVRSALALKLLSFAPSGAIVAAPTTSLPEQPHGGLNWDYRYCWLRDAALTSRALFGLGHHEEATAFVNWLLYSTRLFWPKLPILYDVWGNRPPRERVLKHWSGYRGARPVRIGNAAVDQLQLDVHGEVVEATAQYLTHGGDLDHETERLLVSLAEYVAQNWNQPDEGIWETRHGRREHTFSRLMCWTALDRTLELNARQHLRRVNAALLRSARQAIRKEIETRGWNPRLGAYTQSLGGTRLDASVLLMPWYGFTSAESMRMRMTWDRIKQTLSAGGPLLYRYQPWPGEAEGAFGICSFWGVEYLAMGGGSLAEAREAFQRMLGYANDVGLFGEEIDPETGQALGNFPQAFTHIGLVNAALTLEQRAEAGAQEPLRVSPRSPHGAEAQP